MNDTKYKCEECGEECQIEEELIHYSGTHCTNGNSGVHHTGHYSSTCCEAGYEESEESDKSCEELLKEARWLMSFKKGDLA